MQLFTSKRKRKKSEFEGQFNNFVKRKEELSVFRCKTHTCRKEYTLTHKLMSLKNTEHGPH